MAAEGTVAAAGTLAACVGAGGRGFVCAGVLVAAAVVVVLADGTLGADRVWVDRPVRAGSWTFVLQRGHSVNAGLSSSRTDILVAQLGHETIWGCAAAGFAGAERDGADDVGAFGVFSGKGIEAPGTTVID